MDDKLLKEVRACGFRYGFIAQRIGVTPSYFSQCLNGTRMLSRKKEALLRSLLAKIPKSA